MFNYFNLVLVIHDLENCLYFGLDGFWFDLVLLTFCPNGEMLLEILGLLDWIL